MHEREQHRSWFGDERDSDLIGGQERAPGKRTLTEHTMSPGGELFRAASSGAMVSRADELVARAALSSGSPLPADIRHRFELSLGADLSSVRVHTGEASEVAAEGVAARAYAIGQDIHFAHGQYDPMSADGQRLLAHEVAHTVQQAGGVSARQHSLVVSQPGDFAEIEADRAASAMVNGSAVAVATLSGARSVQRNPDKEADKKWAQGLRTQVQAVQDAAQAAQDTLNADADTALSAITDAQLSYGKFETKYNEAVDRFTSKVSKALEEAEELRENIKTVAGSALGALPGFAGAVVEAASTVSGYAESAEKYLTMAGAVSSKKSEKAEAKAGPTDQVDWKALLKSTIETFRTYLKGNKSIASITKGCLEQIKWLNTVADGNGPDDAKSGTEGQKAQKFADGSTAAIGQLGAIHPGAVSTGATAFAADVQERLDGQSSRKIEQDVAIKWISGLSKDQLGAIDDCDDYLKELGLIDANGNRLGIGTGGWTTEWDTKVIQARAQVEQRAQKMVGTTREWRGGDVHGDSVSSDWWRTVTSGNPKDGDMVRVVSYSMQEIPKEISSTWEHCPEGQLQSKMIGLVTLGCEMLAEPPV
jgi:hypothetical protein